MLGKTPLFAYFDRFFRDRSAAAASPRTRQQEIGAFREAITITPPEDYFPTADDIHRRLVMSGAFKPDHIGWIAADMEARITSESFQSIERGVRRRGELVSAPEKKALGLRANYVVGRIFLDACAVDPKSAARQVFLVAQAALQQSALACEKQRWLEAGLTHCKFQNCRDERDCNAAREAQGKRIAIADARLPLLGCTAEYCRCMYNAVIK